jgi:hypothetical protein
VTPRRRVVGQQLEVRRARKLSRESGVPLTKAAQLVRRNDRLVRELDRGELSFRQLVREIRTLARAVRP